MHRPGTVMSASELQKRYTERAKLRSAEKDIMKMLEKSRAQLTQLQVEALDIKSRIRTTAQSDKELLPDLKTEKPESTGVDRKADGNSNKYEEKLSELDLATNT